MTRGVAAPGRLVDRLPTPTQGAVTHAPRLLLLGCGGVGRAFLQRLQQRGESTPLLGVANSRRALIGPDGTSLSIADRALERAPRRPPTSTLIGLLHPGDIVVDATASAELATQHPNWLARGVNIVTANKLGRGGTLARHRAISDACLQHGVGYGDAATVGAGLPFLRTLRALRAGGDRILSISGLLSGTLGWLLDGYDGQQPFSARVQEARRQGITEPDPRSDLSGEDVKRKLLILLRSAGFELESDAVHVKPLLGLEEGHGDLDRRIDKATVRAATRGGVLRYVARFDPEAGASVGLEILERDDPLANSGSDNALQIRSCRYDQKPLLLQGPGAGTAISAAALLDDVRNLLAAEPLASTVR